MPEVYLIPDDERAIEAFCRDSIRVAGCFAKADIPERWPLHRSEVLDLVRDGMGLEVVAGDVDQLDHFTPPAGGRWYAKHVCALCYCLIQARAEKAAQS